MVQKRIGKVLGSCTFFILIVLVLGCNHSNTRSNKKTFFSKAKGDIYYGGCFRMNEPEFINSLYPPSITDIYTLRIAAQIYEGLVKLNPYDVQGLVSPGVAESYTIDSTGTIYTFHLRKGSRFHDDECFPKGEGRTIKASDIQWCFEQLCNEQNHIGYEIILKNNVVGATEYFENVKAGKKDSSISIEGISILNEYTIQIKLYTPVADFLSLLTMPYAYIYPKEAYEKYGKDLKVGSGPFKVSEIIENESILLEKNKSYNKYDEYGNQLPYLDSIYVTFWQDKNKEILEFKKRNLSMIYQLSTEDILDLVEVQFIGSNKDRSKEYVQQRTPEMIVHYYDFLNTEIPFSSKLVRQAFSYAIDRQLILDKVLEGAGYAPGIYGITPPIFKEYNAAKINGYQLDVKKAQALLAKAGYPNGKGFPKVTLTTTKGSEDIHLAVAEEVKQQLKENLNIDIDIQVTSLSEKMIISKKGQSLFTRSAWVADYMSPQSFLSVLYGKNVPNDKSVESFPNTSRYKNSKFDELYEKGLKAKIPSEGRQYFAEAEAIAIEDAPVLVLWYDENYRIVQPDVINFPNNPLQYRDFTEVWIDFSDLAEEMAAEELEAAAKSDQ